MNPSPLLRGMGPQLPAQCRVLVLGSMPGAQSLAEQQYYAHPRNRFWPVMGALCGFDAGLPYRQRVTELHAAGVGLWDVIGQCERQGSLDTAIIPASEVANPLPSLLASQPSLRLLAFNGNKAAQAFRRHLAERVVIDHPALQYLTLPSTSPANASFSQTRLLQAWQALAPYLRP
ncbi:DNA-deoxyinosine glycosylase [Pseudoxanthomonas dokdonensis]|uniref:DNA glycosylase n=1 Tax=Pseudoxanthomonas dokdonensis TaxID=344882 RepID=A0A0R0D254_9GAMM|nr:DNA-deoxyinosine glycosylase [Pseudoxanthomonas dokdonensis]KRG71651.1 DNA glycosylase [Pseudoxanthomonas dokdonensis]